MVVLVWEDGAFPRREERLMEMLPGWVLRGGCISLMAVALLMLVLRPLPPPPPAHQPDPVQGFHLLMEDSTTMEWFRLI